MSKTKLMVANLSLATLLCTAGWMSTASFSTLAAQEAPAATSEFDFSKTFPPPTGKRIRVGGNAQQKNLLSQVKPVYPPDAKGARIQGTVKLGILVGPEGHVMDVVRITGHPLLTPAAIESVRQWVYRPTLLNGEPVEVVSIVDVNFTLTQ